MFIHTVVLGWALLLSGVCLAAFGESTVRASSTYRQYQGAYRRFDIVESRFGESVLESVRQKVREMDSMLDARFVGQASTKKVLKAKTEQYLNSWGTRLKDPVAIHLLAPPGNGKSDLLEFFSELEFDVIYVDVQRYAGNKDTLAADLRRGQVISEEGTSWPTVLILDEADKLASLTTDESQKSSQVFFGQLNEILTDGKLTVGAGLGKELDLSNVMVVTASNLSPGDAAQFSAQRHKSKRNKSYWDFDIADMQEFHHWVKSSAGTYAALARIYPAPTVTRMAPHTWILDVLTEQDYRDLVSMYLRRTIDRLTGTSAEEGGTNPWLKVRYTPRLEKFLFEHSVFPPSGARHTVAKVDQWVEQLVRVAALASPEEDNSLSQPREVLIDYQRGHAVLTVTPVINLQGRTVAKEPWRVQVDFDPGAQVFVTPAGLLEKGRPDVLENETVRAARVTKRRIAAARGQTGGYETRNLEKEIRAEVFGQEEMISLLASDLREYVALVGLPARPKARVFAGFPGIGKTAAALLVAQKAGLPVIRVNLQSSVSNEANAVEKFLIDLMRRVAVARAMGPSGKYVLLIEEIDKVYEINPKNGMPEQRPILSVIKDLLDSGMHTTTSAEGGDMDVDIRDALSFYTMNFGSDIFGFKADPRLTSLEDVDRARLRLTNSKAALRDFLSTLYLPDTVNRLLEKMYIVPGLRAEDHARILSKALETVAEERFVNAANGLNEAQIDLSASPEYLRYLSDEAVIPSEGGRYTEATARRKISHDVEMGIAQISSVEGFKLAPLAMQLHYRPASQTVVVRARRSEVAADRFQVLAEKKVTLSFPRPYLRGRIPENRLFVATHEFGHAYTHLLLGGRFRSVTVIDPDGGELGGYLLPAKAGLEAVSGIAKIHTCLGSLAMERIVNGGETAREPQSVLRTSQGGSQDIKMATEMLYSMIHELGMDPGGGTSSRSGPNSSVSGEGRAYTVYGALTAQEGIWLSKVLRRLEDELVEKLLQSRSRDWYIDKIKVFARFGELSEKQFYDLVELGSLYPGPGKRSLGVPEYGLGDFREVMQKMSPEELRLQRHPWGMNHASMEQNLERAIEDFKAALEEQEPTGVSTEQSDCPRAMAKRA